MPDDPTMDDVRAAAEQVHAELAEQYERRMEVLREATKALIVQLSYKPCAACGLPNPERDGADCNSCADKAEALAEARSALDAERDQRTLTEKPELWQEPKCIGGDCRPEWNWRRADCPVHGTTRCDGSGQLFNPAAKWHLSPCPGCPACSKPD